MKYNLKMTNELTFKAYIRAWRFISLKYYIIHLKETEVTKISSSIASLYNFLQINMRTVSYSNIVTYDFYFML